MGHKLDAIDKNRRFWFCNELIRRIKIDSTLLPRMIFFDEVYIKLNSHACTYNLYYYDKENPNMIVNRKSNGQGLMFLVRVSTRGYLIYCFDTETIPERFAKDKNLSKKCKNNRSLKRPYGRMPCNSGSFLDLFKSKVLPDMGTLFPDIPTEDIIVVLDGSSVHTEKNVTSFLSNTFKDWYGNNSDLGWPSHSPVRSSALFLVFIDCFHSSGLDAP